MANISKAHLFDKDIRNLKAKDKRYKVAVGSPKELYLFVHPSGTKTFFLRLAGDKIVSLKEFRPGIYSVVEARRDANALLAQLAQGKELDVILGKSDNYKFKNLFDKFIEQKRKRNKESTIVRTIRTVSTYILPKFGDRDVKDIKRSELLEVFNAIFNPNNPSKSRLETLRRLIGICKNVFNIAIKDRYIDYNPCFDLEKEFPTSYLFNHTHGIDTRYPALTEETNIKEFLDDLKADNNLDFSTKRAIYLQILCVNRPGNTASAKWKNIDLEKGVWTINAVEMKTGVVHQIALSSYAKEILKEQQLFSGSDEFVFPSTSAKGHLNRDSIGKAIKNLGGKGKYKNRATSHGFRSTFRTICSTHKAELYDLGITEEAIESALAHAEPNEVKRSYERRKATIEQIATLMQWYGDYLNSITPLF
nr:tyrosine-type recombinase/integrase [uncultured Campylobacter sp.]